MRREHTRWRTPRSVAKAAVTAVLGCLFAGGSGACDESDGGDGQPCRLDGTCDGDLVCVGGECSVALDGSPSPAADALASFTLVVDLLGEGTGRVTDGDSFNCPTIDCSWSYAPGTEVLLRANAEPWSVFSAWGGDCAPESDSSCALTMDRDKNIAAVFESTFLCNNDFFIEPNDTTSSATLTGIPAEGLSFSSHSLAICPATDIDVFAFAIAVNPKDISAVVEVVAAEEVPVLEIWDEVGAVLAVGSMTGPSTLEALDSSAPVGTYFVAVRAGGGAGRADYNVFIETTMSTP